MLTEFKKVSIFGARVISMSIACHLANVGIESYVVNIEPTDIEGMELTLESICKLLQQKKQRTAKRLKSFLVSNPTNLYIQNATRFIHVCDGDDFTKLCSEVDWIIEALTEKYEFKKSVLGFVEKNRKPDAVVSTATSEISIDVLASNFSENFKQHFLGTHFFYPVRHRRLLEIIPGQGTLPDVLNTMIDFGERVLGKGVIVAKDFPFFIARRIIVYDILSAFRAAQEEGMTVEEVDTVMGETLGRPESAIFRTADLIGLDSINHVLKILQREPDNRNQDLFELPGFICKMTKNQWTGDRAGQGFYRNTSDDLNYSMVLDYRTMQYRPILYPMFSSLMISQLNCDLSHRIKTTISVRDKIGRFVWKVLKKTLLFSASGLPLIADNPVNIDRAVKWGYNWELGPFEIWDAIGLEDSVARMVREGEHIPPWIEALLTSGKKSIYQTNKKNQTRVYDLKTTEYKKAPASSDTIFLTQLHNSKHIIKSDCNANLIDLGDGIACLELHPSEHAVNDVLIEMVRCSLEVISKDFDGLIISGDQGDDFPFGLDYMHLLREAEDKHWSYIEHEMRSLQQMMSAIKYCPKATISAPFQQTLSVACELVLSTSQIQAAAETYMGFADVHFGLLPSGGGIKELLLRVSQQNCGQSQAGDGMDHAPIIRLFENIITARISTNAFDARQTALITASDRITLNPDYLIFDAKQAVIKLNNNGFKSPATTDHVWIKLAGHSGYNKLMDVASHMREQDQLSDYDFVIADQLARVITGGDIESGTSVEEEHILDLERESFLSLIGDSRTQDRIRSMFRG